MTRFRIDMIHCNGAKTVAATWQIVYDYLTFLCVDTTTSPP